MRLIVSSLSSHNLLLLLLESFSHKRYLMVFQLSLSDSKFPQVSRTLLSILIDLNNAVVWMMSSRPFISKSFGPFINPLMTVSSAPIIIGINVAFRFHSFFSSLVRSRYLFFFHFLSIFLCGQPGKLSWQFGKFFFLFLIIIKSGHLTALLASFWHQQVSSGLQNSFQNSSISISNWGSLKNHMNPICVVMRVTLD